MVPLIDRDGLYYGKHDGIARIVFNRPEALNAVNSAMAQAFLEAIRDVESDPALRVLVLTGRGRAFMAGGDLAEISHDPPRNSERIIHALHEGLLRMCQLPIPVLAGLQGAVAGAGMSVALAADLALAADNTTFQMAYAQVGASPDASGSWHLVQLVGLRKAMELALLSERLDAPAALRLGLVNRVVPAEAFSVQLDTLAKQLAKGPTKALGRTKTLLRAASGRALADQLQAEQQAFVEGAAGDEFREGMAAFLEKRAPCYDRGWKTLT